MQQVFLNLILNALQACGRGGHITISTSSENGTVLIRIQDDGPGIPEDVANRIFEPFFTTKEKGTGLGLSITHTIIEQHGGTIGLVKCEKGTCFEIGLPKLRESRDDGGNNGDMRMTATSILDTYLLSLTCSCERVESGECPSEVIKTLSSLDMESRKKVLRTLDDKEKLRIQQGHINCPLDRQK
jgi:hypothetical protein